MRTERSSWRAAMHGVGAVRVRRGLAAMLAGLAVLAGLSALRPHAAPTAQIWVAARDLTGGIPLARADLALRRLPRVDVPHGAFASGIALVGRLVAAPMRAGEPLTDVRLLDPALLSALGTPGLVAVPVRLADGAAAAAVAHPGDIVDVLATDDGSGAPARSDPTVIAGGVTVLAVPPRDGSGDPGGLVVVAATTRQAASLARAGAATRLSLVLRRPA